MQLHLLLLAFLLLLMLFQYGYMLFFFSAFPKLQQKQKAAEKPVLDEELPPISLVVCARNELKNLQQHLPLWLAQDYPQFEVVVVNDRSWDESDLWLDEMAEKHPRLKVRHLRDFDRHWIGKKFALTIGIKAATHDRLVLTDADCSPASPHWLRKMGEQAKGDAFVLGYGAYEGKGGVALLSQFETQLSALHWMSWASKGMAYMGVGRNLSYTRTTFLEKNGFSGHMHIPSGDDDLFVGRAAKGKKTLVCIHPQAFTFSPSPESWKKWLAQKERHLSTAHAYHWVTKSMLGGWGGSSLLSYGLLVFIPWLWSLHPAWVGLLAGRWLLLWIFYSVANFRLQGKWLGFFLPFFELPLLLSQLYLHRRYRAKGIKQTW